MKKYLIGLFGLGLFAVAAYATQIIRTDVIEGNDAPLEVRGGISLGDGPLESSGNVNLLTRHDLRLQDTTGGQYVGFQAPSTVASSLVFDVPGADGSVGQFMKTDGAGALSFATVQVVSTTSAAIIADNQAFVVGGATYVSLTSDDATSTNRTFTLNSCAGKAGAQLLLYWDDTDAGELADSGNAALLSTWSPTDVGEKMFMVCHGSIWSEIVRTASM